MPAHGAFVMRWALGIIGVAFLALLLVTGVLGALLNLALALVTLLARLVLAV